MLLADSLQAKENRLLMSTAYHKFCQDCQAMSVESQSDHFTVRCTCNKLHGLVTYR